MRRSYFVSVLHVLRALDADKVLVLYEVNEEYIVSQWHIEKVGETWYLTKQFYAEQILRNNKRSFTWIHLEIYLVGRLGRLQNAFKVYIKSSEKGGKT